MIKSTSTEHTKPPTSKYPYIARYTYKNSYEKYDYLVMFIGLDKGTVIRNFIDSDSGYDKRYVGYYAQNFSEEDFKFYSGKVILENS